MTDIEMENAEVNGETANIAKNEPEQEQQIDFASDEQLPSEQNGNGNGVELKEEMDSANQENPISDYENNEAYQMFMAKNLSKPVAENLIHMFEALELNTDEFDDRAVEMLATFPEVQANYIIREIRNSRLYGVQNKPQYLMSVMRNFRDRLRTMGVQQAMDLPLIPGPDPEKIKELIDRTGYQLEVTVGQRKFHSPPGYQDPNQQSEGGNATSSLTEIYIGQIPKDVYEDALVPLFEPVGTIYDLRIMMDPVNGKSRGYGFLIYMDKANAQEAAKKYDGHEILPGKPLRVNVSVANTRLFLGNIPKSKSKEEILEELRKHAENVTDVIIYSNPDAHDGRKNRGFCFVDFTDHKAASDAKRRISMGKIRPWNTDLVVDWAEQQDEPDEEVMSQVKVLYVRNLKESVTEERLKEMFDPHGEVEKVKRIKDYAFVHFNDRQAAIQAMEALKGTVIEGVEVEISLAKPQGDQNQKKKIAMKQRFGGAQSYGPAATPGLGRGGRGRGGGGGYDYMPGPSRGRGGGAGPSPRGGMGGGYGPYYGYPPAAGYPTAQPSYDPYYPGYHGYDMYSGYPPAAEAYYAPPPPPGPPYGLSPMRGGAGGYGGYGTIQRGRGGKASGGMPAGRGAKRGYGGGGRGGSKRSGSDFGGPASKRGGRGGHGQDDFSSDVSMNMF